MARLGTVSDRKLVLHRRNPKGADHHRRERIRELALEHRAFARHHPMMLRDFVEQERREDVRKVNLSGAFEVSFRILKHLAHYTEIHPLGAEDVANLAQHLLNPNVRAHVASTVVSRKEKL